MKNILKITGKAGSGKTRALRILAEAAGATPFVLREVGGEEGLREMAKKGEGKTGYYIDEVTPHGLKAVESVACVYQASYFIISVEA